VSSTPNSSVLTTTFTTLGTLTCPNGTTGCKAYSNPLLQNNVIWQNRAFYIGVGAPNSGLTNQQNQITLFQAFTSTKAPAQTAFGQCGAASYWDIGVRGDKTVTGHESGFKLNPTYSVLDDTGYASSNKTTNPSIVSQYCNGGRVPPTCSVADGCGGPSGYGVPPGIVDASAPNPVFSLTPSATVDEGNNWINVSWGPLALSDDSVTGGLNNNFGGGNLFGNYALNASSPAIDYVPLNSTNLPTTADPTLITDFFGNRRPDLANPSAFDVGAIEYQGVGTQPAVLSVTGGPLSFGNVVVGSSSAAQTLTLHNTGAGAGTGIALTFSSTVFARPGGTCTATLAAGATCTITVAFTPTAVGPATGTLTITASVAVAGSPVGLSGTGVAAVKAATLTPTSHNYGGQTRNCPGTGLLGILACAGDPSQTFTLTNTGNVTLTGVGQGVLGGTNSNEFTIGPLSSCGTNSIFGNFTTLAPGGTCTVIVRFTPLTAQPTGVKNATISVTETSLGTQTSTLTGTAN
jgi:hypothetical protein